MKKLILKIWNMWCKKVEEHNKPLMCYETQEECWRPSTIFIPLILSVVSAFIWALFSILVEKYHALAYTPYWGLCGLIVGGLMLFINWNFYKEKRRN